MKEKIFEALRRDHDTQRHLLNQLVETQGDTEGRRTLYANLKENLQEHAKFEERFFYAPLMKHDITSEKSRHSVHEHHEIDECVEKIDELNFDSPNWLKNLKELKHLVEHHLEEEEQEVFQLAGKALNESQKKDLADKYTESMTF